MVNVLGFAVDMWTPVLRLPHKFPMLELEKQSSSCLLTCFKDADEKPETCTVTFL